MLPLGIVQPLSRAPGGHTALWEGSSLLFQCHVLTCTCSKVAANPQALSTTSPHLVPSLPQVCMSSSVMSSQLLGSCAHGHHLGNDERSHQNRYPLSGQWGECLMEKGLVCEMQNCGCRKLTGSEDPAGLNTHRLWKEEVLRVGVAPVQGVQGSACFLEPPLCRWKVGPQGLPGWQDLLHGAGLRAGAPPARGWPPGWDKELPFRLTRALLAPSPKKVGGLVPQPRAQD